MKKTEMFVLEMIHRDRRSGKYYGGRGKWDKKQSLELSRHPTLELAAFAAQEFLAGKINGEGKYSDTGRDVQRKLIKLRIKRRVVAEKVEVVVWPRKP